MSFLRRVNTLIARNIPVKTARACGPAASISFDDFPKSAWAVGGPILARHGARATYYTAGGLCGRTLEGIAQFDAGDLRALAAAGHELACHGFAHEAAPELSSGALAADAARNAAFLKEFLGGREPESYAYPYGAVSLRVKRQAARRYRSARSVHPGINDGRIDLAQLNAVSIESRSWDPRFIDDALARAKQNGGWIIFYTHDVGEAPSEYGSTPAMLTHVLERLAGEKIAVLPVREAMAEAVEGGA